MVGSWSEPIAPALMAAGLLCIVIPWSNRENPFVRATLVTFTLALTWHYLLWRITTLPQFGSVDWLFGSAFFAAELLTGIGGTITWILLTRSSSRSAAVASNMPWLMQARPLALSVLVALVLSFVAFVPHEGRLASIVSGARRLSGGVRKQRRRRGCIEPRQRKSQ